jgi:hypothetical protein
MPAIGSRAQVMNGTAHHTPGGLTKKHLKYNKHGRIVSRKASMKAKKNNRLAKAGFIPKKGEFKLFKKGDGKKSKKMRGGTGQYEMPESGPLQMALGASGGSRRRRMRGGKGLALSPSSYDGQGVGTSGNAVQFEAGNAN